MTTLQVCCFVFFMVTGIYHDIKGNDARAAKQLIWAVIAFLAIGGWRG